MKIKIITYTFSQNIGAILQAYNLKKYISKNFRKNVIFTNYQPFQLYLRENFNFLRKKNIFEIISGLKKFLKIYLWKKKNFKIKKYQRTYDNAESLNIFGSDEIWNYSNPFFKYQKFYFGFGTSKTKIAYAASIGNAKFKDLSQSIKKELRKNLSKFKKISVRDSNTKKFVKKLIKINPPIVVDPIFLNADKTFNSAINYKLKKEKYILVYGKIRSEFEVEKIKSFAQKKNAKIISILFKNDWANINLLSIDPWEFENYIKNSIMIFTSMFHGVMFSVKFKKQFWIYHDPYRENKLEYFLKYLKLENRYLLKNKKFNEKINYRYVNSKLNIWITNSKKFLKQNIK